jgi:mRNA turnover protein 4
MGRNAVMRKALGSTPEAEHKPNTSIIGNQLEGDVGLLFTDEEPHVVTEWFESFKVPDFARAGNEATEDFTLPEGAFGCRVHPSIYVWSC